MHNALQVSVVAALVALSGCALLAPVHEYPPGVSEAGVHDATALADAHQNALRQGYHVERVTTYTATNGTVLQRVESTGRWTPTEANQTIRFATQHIVLGVEAQLYSNESGAWIHTRTASGGTGTWSASPVTLRGLLPSPGIAWEAIYAMAAAPTTSTTTLQNGTTRISFSDANLGRGNATGTMLVTPQGFIRQYEVTYDGRWRNENVTVHTLLTYRLLENPDIVTPDWIGNATA